MEGYIPLAVKSGDGVRRVCSVASAVFALRFGDDCGSHTGMILEASDHDPSAPQHPGTYHATGGPWDGPILRRDDPPTLGVVTSPGTPMPIGVAYAVGQVMHRKGVAVTFRLAIGE